MDTFRPHRAAADTRFPRRRAPRTRSRAGFTVAEVMIATFVMLFGIASSIIVLQSGFRAIDTARNTTLAAQIIQSEMERIRLLSWTAVNNLPTSTTLAINQILPDDLPSLTELENRFTVTRAATDVTGKVGEMKQITVSITWRGIDGQSHVRTSTTHYCKEGLYAYYYTKARS